MSITSSKKLEKWLVLVACSILLFTLVVWSFGRVGLRRHSFQISQLKVENKTSALRVTGTEIVDEEAFPSIKITLLNQSQQIVLAYTISMGENAITSIGLSLAPGDSKTERIPISNLTPSVLDENIRQLAISAVYLADGTTEGNEIDVNRLSNRILGMQEQAAASLLALRTAAASQESEPEKLKALVESRLASSFIPSSDTQIASERLAGRQLIKEKITREMNSIRGNKHESRAELVQQLELLTNGIEDLSGIRHSKKEGNK